jgi:WD40 repeat protein/serine/threonine protein kinase
MSREEEIFEQALALTSSETRQGYLLGACAGDAELRRRVEELLAAHREAGVIEFLKDSTRTEQQAGIFVPEQRLSEKPGDHIGRFKLLEKVGEGGCGVVYVAEQEEPVRRRVALKVIKLGMDTRQVVARFEAERQALAMMDHPNIAKVLDAGATETGRPYFVMELVRGIRITDYCDQNQLSTQQRLELFIQVCRAVQHAHQKGIIHRDLKPSNILVTLHDGVPVPKVIDFGIAKATEGRLTDLTVYTELHQFIGTPAYMSPEQAEMSGLDIDTRSDIYSLGVLLYELLTGRTPFDAKELLAAGLDEMRRTIREREPVRPSTRLGTMLAVELTTTAQRRGAEAPKLVHLVRGDLDWIVMKALEKDRTRRYETANGFAADIERHLNQEPVIARPPSNVYRFQKLVRRNKIIFAAAAGVVVSLLFGTAISVWQAVRATHFGKQALSSGHTAREAQRRAEHQLYLAKMNLAQGAWEQNNIRRVREILNETATHPERGFEWFYWQRQTHLELKSFGAHSKAVLGVAFSPDGKQIITGSWDGTARIWDIASGEQLLSLDPRDSHDTGLNAVAFSPDGSRVITGSMDPAAKVWDSISGKPLLALKGGHNAPYAITAVAFSPKGDRIVTGSSDNTARVWDASTGKPLVTLVGHTNLIRSVAFSPDGNRVATGCGHAWDDVGDCTARIWDATNGSLLFNLTGHTGSVHAVTFSPEGNWLLTGSWDGTTRIWDASNGQQLRIMNATPSGPILAAAFSPNGEQVITGSQDQTATLWEVATGQPLHTYKGHAASIVSVAFSPDGRKIATASGDWMPSAEHTAKIWDAQSDQEVLTLRGHSQINAIACSPDGQHFVTAESDGIARVWEASRGKELFPLQGHNGVVQSAAFSPDGKKIVTASYDKTAKVWDAVSGNLLLTLAGHSDNVMTAVFSSDGQRIVTGSWDDTAKLWEATTGNLLHTFDGHIWKIWSAAISPDGQKIAAAGNTPTIGKVWDVATGKELFTLKGHNELLFCVAFSPDGRRIITGGSDRTAKVWDATTGLELFTLNGHRGEVSSVGFSSDGKRIVTTGSSDRTAKIWDTASGQELLTLKGHSDSIHSAVFSPDCRKVITGSGDRTARIWQAASDQEVAMWQKEETKLEAVAGRIPITPDPGAIRDWLVLAPISFEGQTEKAALVALDEEHIAHEGDIANTRPLAGQAIKIGPRELVWRALNSETHLINLTNFFGQEAGPNLAYAFCYIASDKEQTGLSMRIAAPDQAKVYLNGKQVYRQANRQSTWQEQDQSSVGVDLNAGLNSLVFKLVNQRSNSLASIRLTDARDQPIQGIRVTLAP